MVNTPSCISGSGRRRKEAEAGRCLAPGLRSVGLGATASFARFRVRLGGLSSVPRPVRPSAGGLGCSSIHRPHNEPPTLRLRAAGCGSRRSRQRPHARVGNLARLPRECPEGEKAEPAPGSALAQKPRPPSSGSKRDICGGRRVGGKWGCPGTVGRAESWVLGSRGAVRGAGLEIKDAFEESTKKYITSSNLTVDLTMENLIGASLN
ncbi:uncharacterized protein LOC123651268 [Pipistrellus kuhlii]|uniref:uncharacterized protein LOC123651268 n=1 Tax=Pipistrellus kuhlii TaxID=59472 RepID=UPI001E27419D|nr:uncharacterized protein LOC123651268 [Pipistrellus kuhlii]